MNTMLGIQVQNTIVSLKCNGREIYGMNVGEHRNRYFVSVADELTAGIPSESFSNHSVRPIAKSFHFQPTNANEIGTIIKRIKSKSYHKDECHRTGVS